MAHRVILLITITLTLWISGFFWFVGQIPDTQTKPHERKRTDGIIVLTGGNGRIEGALRILVREYTKKLLITGVHNQVDLQNILRASGLTGEDPEMGLSERIIAGHMATDTKGNAEEALIWMMFENYNSALIVTANYHMPRALYEFQQRMPDKQFELYPIQPAGFHLKGWWHHPRSMALLLSEYHKYIGTRGYGAIMAL
jgi:uncharacterized SAM-binding protein YcdF (DUF218 family)